MIRTAFITSLVLSIALIGACEKRPDGTTQPPTDGQTAGTDGGGGEKDDGKKHDKKHKGDDKGDDKGGDKVSDENDPTKKVCPAETSEYPEAYFADTVLIRLPKGVTGDNFVEFTPTFARLSSVVDSVSCVQDVPGATITYMAMTYFEDDKAKDMNTMRDETIAAMGYVAPKLSAEKRDDKIRFYQAVVDVEGTPEKPDPGRALFQMSAANGIMYAVVYECHPLAWNALKETFYASAAKISFLKPR